MKNVEFVFWGGMGREGKGGFIGFCARDCIGIGGGRRETGDGRMDGIGFGWQGAVATVPYGIMNCMGNRLCGSIFFAMV